MERDLAAQAGLGWFGKSTNVIDQSLGSYLFLGELLLGHELDTVVHEAPDRCGRCTACIDLCPTGAILAPYKVDARRCISYLTIELRGPIPRALRSAIGDHLFGCDICQIVCPWNRKARPLHEAAFRPRPEIEGLTAADLLRLSADEFAARFAGSPIRRAGRDGMARNAAVVLGNSGNPRVIPDLVGALRADASPIVRSHAAWALGRMAPASSARLALELARMHEPVELVRREITQTLEDFAG
jgi:epoxyqueuosine reductase